MDPILHRYYLVGEELAGCFSFCLFCVLSVCHGLFSLPFGVTCGLCSVIEVISWHIYYFSVPVHE